MLQPIKIQKGGPGLLERNSGPIALFEYKNKPKPHFPWLTKGGEFKTWVEDDGCPWGSSEEGLSQHHSD